MNTLRPLERVSYDNTSALIFQYSAADVAVDVTQDDVTGDCVIFYQNYAYGQRYLTRSFTRTKNLIQQIIEKYPMKEFICAVDY